jgi:hypothetical protein
MITISRNEEIVSLDFDTQNGWSIPFEYKRSCKMDAELLMRRMQDVFRRKIEDIRRLSYEEGWKDKASKKTAKKKYFSSTI